MRRRSRRRRETALARNHRLTTRTGSGAFGKTSAAVNLGRTLLERTDAEVWLGEFTPLRDASLVAAAIAQALLIAEAPNRPALETLLTQLEEEDDLAHSR